MGTRVQNKNNNVWISLLFLQQPDLPKLPVPELEKTLQRYLEAVQPILSPEQFSRAQDLAKQLAENEGPELQHHLVERQIKLKNWARKYFFSSEHIKITHIDNLTFYELCGT